MMRRIIFAALSLVLALTLASCKGKGDGVVTDSESSTGILDSIIPSGDTASPTTKNNGMGTQSPSESSTNASGGTSVTTTPIEPVTTDIASADDISGLNASQKEFIKGLGTTVEGQKLVCMSENKDYAAYWVYNFENGKVSRAKMYTLAKSASFFESLISTDTTVAEDGMNRELLCIVNDLTDEYKDNTYSQMLLIMSNATVITESK